MNADPGALLAAAVGSHADVREVQRLELRADAGVVEEQDVVPTADEAGTAAVDGTGPRDPGVAAGAGHLQPAATTEGDGAGDQIRAGGHDELATTPGEAAPPMPRSGQRVEGGLEGSRRIHRGEGDALRAEAAERFGVMVQVCPDRPLEMMPL